MGSAWNILCLLLCTLCGTRTTEVLELLQSIKKEESFDYLVLMKYHNSSVSENFRNGADGQDFAWSLMDYLGTPVVQLDERVNYFLYDKHSNRVLSVVFLLGLDFELNVNLINTLVKNLRIMTISRVVFMVQLDEANETFLYKLFTYCWKMKLLNVVALFENYETTKTLYSYKPFPSYQLEERLHDPDSITFPDRMKNLYGYSVRIIIGGVAPRIIMYYDKRGNVVYKGTLGHFMDAFRQKYNCTVTQPYPATPDNLVPSTELVAAVTNEVVDLSLAITFPDRLHLRPFTYPYEQMNWCLMLPVEADVPRTEYYINVFELEAFLVTLAIIVLISVMLSVVLKYHGYTVHPYEFVLHDTCLRGVLGQSFYQVRRASIHIRFMYIQICLLGFLLTAWYNSYFSAYVTSVPKEPPFRSFDDILASKLKISAWKPEYSELFGRLADFRKYQPMFRVEPNFEKFIRIRDSFDTSQGYMMPSSKWIVINAQQQIFSQPLFRMRNDFCFFNNIPLGFPVHENSIYKQPIHSLILDLLASGLVAHWTSKGFMEQVEAGELELKDLSERRDFRPMQVQDLLYVWYGFAFMAAISSMVLLAELVWHWLRRRRQC